MDLNKPNTTYYRAQLDGKFVGENDGWFEKLDDAKDAVNALWAEKAGSHGNITEHTTNISGNLLGTREDEWIKGSFQSEWRIYTPWKS